MRRWDEGYVPVALLVMGYAGVCFGATFWTVLGALCVVLGFFVTIAISHGNQLHGQAVSAATSFAIVLAKFWPLWALFVRAILR